MDWILGQWMRKPKVEFVPSVHAELNVQSAKSGLESKWVRLFFVVPPLTNSGYGLDLVLKHALLIRQSGSSHCNKARIGCCW